MQLLLISTTATVSTQLVNLTNFVECLCSNAKNCKQRSNENERANVTVCRYITVKYGQLCLRKLSRMTQ